MNQAKAHEYWLQHCRDAERLYTRYVAALAKIDAHESKILAEQSGNAAAAAERLSDAHPSRDWVYRALLGARNGLADQLRIEIAMAGLYHDAVTTGLLPRQIQPGPEL